MPDTRQQLLENAAAGLGGSSLRKRVEATRGAPEPTGPQAKLFKNPFSTGDLRFPQNIASASFENLHRVTFYINVQEKTSYNVKEELDPNAVSAANENRFADAQLGIGQLSGGTQALNSTIAESVSAGALGAQGATYFANLGQKIGAAAGAVSGSAAGGVGAIPGALAGAATGKLGGAITGTVLGAGFGTAIVKSIDLSRKTKRIKSTISLYMPDTVQTTMSHQYQGVSMTGALGTVGALGQGAAAVGTSISEFMKQGMGKAYSPDLRGAGTAPIAELAGTLAEGSGVFGQGIKDAILFSAGLAQNPQVEILYQQTEHRNFTFAFKMIPRSKDEAKIIRDIVKQFKFYAAPEILAGSTGRFFVPPAEFDIKFFFNDRENLNINKISTCVLTRIDVNYASAGQWTTFDDGMPVETMLQLEFQELEIMHKKRIEDGY